MEYIIKGQTVPTVEFTLNQNETLYTQSGGMIYHTSDIKTETTAKGGVLASLGRVFAGESLFMANYMATSNNQKIAFAASVPGTIIPVNLTTFPEGMILQKKAFLCAEQTVSTTVEFTKKFSAGLFGGEGFILQRATGTGNLFLEVDGDAITFDLQPGEILKVDTGNVVAFTPTVSYEIEMVHGFKNVLFGGEGLFHTKLVGPGKVVIQTQNFREFANKIIPYIPTRSD